MSYIYIYIYIYISFQHTLGRTLKLVTRSLQIVSESLNIISIYYKTNFIGCINDAYMRDDDVLVVLFKEYLQQPTLVRTLPTGKPVYGVAVLDAELFVVRRETAELEVYDCATSTPTRRLAIDGLVNPVDMAAGGGGVYVVDEGYVGRDDKVVHRVDAATGTATKWSLGGDVPYGISVTTTMTSSSGRDDKNSDVVVVVTFPDARRLKEYTGDGRLVRQVQLPDDITNPWHAVRLPASPTVGGARRYVVCHGWKTDALNRVCVVEENDDDDGRVVDAYGGPPGFGDGKLNVPIRLAVDGDGFVVVADVENRCVLLLSTAAGLSGDVGRQLLRRDGDRPSNPTRLCLDGRRGSLFVAECETDGQAYIGGEVLEFHVKDV